MKTAEIRTILVGVLDPDARRQPAVDRAAMIAKGAQANVILFHAAFESALSGRPFFDSPRLARSRGELVHRRQQAMERHAAKLERSGIPTAVRVVWQEPAHAALIQASIREDADLVVVGAHRTAQARTPFLRHNDWELLRASPRPVLIVRALSSDSLGPVIAALDPRHMNDKPAALDAALAKNGAALARALGVDMHAVHCVADSAYPLGPVTNADRQRVAKTMHARIRRVVQKNGKTMCKVHVLHGQAEQALPMLVKKLKASILVLGALSRRGLARLAVGNTAERLIHETSCDLLIIKPPEFSFRLPRLTKQSVVLPQ